MVLIQFLNGSVVLITEPLNDLQTTEYTQQFAASPQNTHSSPHLEHPDVGSALGVTTQRNSSLLSHKLSKQTGSQQLMGCCHGL